MCLDFRDLEWGRTASKYAIQIHMHTYTAIPAIILSYHGAWQRSQWPVGPQCARRDSMGKACHSMGYNSQGTAIYSPLIN